MRYRIWKYLNLVMHMQAVESKQGAIIKKRSAIPTSRSAFGDLDNKLPVSFYT